MLDVLPPRSKCVSLALNESRAGVPHGTQSFSPNRRGRPRRFARRQVVRGRKRTAADRGAAHRPLDLAGSASLSATPRRPAIPRGRPVDHPRPRLGASRVACASLVYMLSPLPRRSDWDRICSITQSWQPSPIWRSGRPAHRPFRGLLGVHSRYGLHTRAVTVCRDTLDRRLQRFRYLHRCSGCFRLEQLPGGVCTHWESAAFSRRTPEADIASAVRNLREGEQMNF
jgi:hypothetical protein